MGLRGVSSAVCPARCCSTRPSTTPCAWASTTDSVVLRQRGRKGKALPSSPLSASILNNINPQLIIRHLSTRLTNPHHLPSPTPPYACRRRNAHARLLLWPLERADNSLQTLIARGRWRRRRSPSYHSACVSHLGRHVQSPSSHPTPESNHYTHTLPAECGASLIIITTPHHGRGSSTLPAPRSRTTFRLPTRPRHQCRTRHRRLWGRV